MKVGDLVYVPYFEEYGIIVRKTSKCPTSGWHIVYTSGWHSDEYEEDLEAVCK